MSSFAVRDINCYEDFILNQREYEKQLFLLARISVFIEEEHSKLDGKKYFDNDTFILIRRLVEECTFTLGSQSDRWRDASARLSADPGDFGVFEMRRTVDAIKLPTMFAKLRRMVESVFGHCPEI